MHAVIMRVSAIIIFWANFFAHERPVISPELYAKKQGEVAVVMGNGPSINQVDFTLLHGTDTFVVNSFYLHPRFDEINPAFYVIADPVYAEFHRAETQKFWGQINEKNSQAQFLLSYHFKAHDVKTVLAENQFSIVNSSLSYEYNFFRKRKIDLHYPIPGVQNVVLLGILAAIGLGYKKIVLLGCEHDWLSSLKDYKCFYEEDIKYPDSDHKPYFWWLDSVNTMFLQYAWAEKYARRHGVEIVNCTNGGVLDVFRCSKLGAELAAP